MIVDTGVSGTKNLPPIDDASLNASVKYATGVLSRMERIEANLVNSGVIPAVNSPAHSQFVHYYPNDAALEKGFKAMVAIGASAQLTQAHCIRLVYLYTLYCLMGMFMVLMEVDWCLDRRGFY